VFRITGIIEKTPAEKSGLQKNDIVLSINGTSVKGISLGEALNLIEQSGRRLYFEVDRNGTIMDFTMKLFKVL